MPFQALRSAESQARLSLRRCVHDIAEAGVVGKGYKAAPKYAHNESDVKHKRRGPLQLVSTYGFVVNQVGKVGAHMELVASELAALHECINWLRSGNNVLFGLFYGPYNDFVQACSVLCDRVKSIVPEVNPLTKVRSQRNTRNAVRKTYWANK
jgi:hypothetical protein